MKILSDKYYMGEKVTACFCAECHRFADIPATIVHSPNCSQYPQGAKMWGDKNRDTQENKMNTFLVWFAESREASYLRTFLAVVLYQAITTFANTGTFDMTDWKQWVIAGLIPFLPLLTRVKNPQDSLS